jgi:multimeric flavodoxin WrbA
MLLGFNGSPKPDSNLRRIIEMMLKESGKDYRIYDLAQMDIKPCMGCVKCAKNNRCVMKDDMFPLYFENDPEIVKRAKKIGKRLGNL